MFVRKNFIALIILLLWGILPTCTVTNDDAIQKQLFDLNWKFSLENHKSANEIVFNDFNWIAIDLPHNWSSDPLLKELPGKTALESQSNETGWYRKNFEIPENWQGKKIGIEFEGISEQHEIFLNGTPVKCSDKGTRNIKADLTPVLNSKGNNLIAVRIRVPSEPKLTPTSETGIFSHVWLVIKENGTNP
jgi:beta-galactosidase